MARVWSFKMLEARLTGWHNDIPVCIYFISPGAASIILIEGISMGPGLYRKGAHQCGYKEEKEDSKVGGVPRQRRGLQFEH